MHISGKIMIPIGIVFIILSGILIATIDSEEHIQKLDQDGYLILDFYQDDQDGEKTKTLGFSFWIEGEYIDADGNGLWDACEEFNASVTGPPGHPDADTERFQLICDEKDEEWTYYFQDEKWKEGKFKDGKEDGLWIYYTNGHKWKEETYIDNNISKISHYYTTARFYRNGQIQAQGNTDFWGNYDGKWTYYNPDGTIKELKEY